MKLTLVDVLVILAYFAFNLGDRALLSQTGHPKRQRFFCLRPQSQLVAGRNLHGRDDVRRRHAPGRDRPRRPERHLRQLDLVEHGLQRNADRLFLCPALAAGRRPDRRRSSPRSAIAASRPGSSAASGPFTSVLPINLIIMGWVNLAIVKILMLVLGVTKVQALGIAIGIMVITASISTLSGLMGSPRHRPLPVRPEDGHGHRPRRFRRPLDRRHGRPCQRNPCGRATDSRAKARCSPFVPDLNSTWMPLITFFVYIAVNWWASWYPGAEPGGGGFIAQRIFCAKDEKHSVLATLWFNITHYALRPWPWILVALVAVVKFQRRPGVRRRPRVRLYPDYDHRPSGLALRGLMLAAFAAAYMSTIGTELNWGASYLVNDLYRRFLGPGAGEKHYVAVSQAMTMLLMVLSAVVTFFMASIADAWKFMIALGAGTGLVYLLRWFWWRINAWSEVSAMVAAFVTSLAARFGLHFREERAEGIRPDRPHHRRGDDGSLAGGHVSDEARARRRPPGILQESPAERGALGPGRPESDGRRSAERRPVQFDRLDMRRSYDLCLSVRRGQDHLRRNRPRPGARRRRASSSGP